MDYKALYKSKKCSVEECLAQIQSGDIIATGTDGNAATAILKQLHTIADRVKDVWVIKGADNVYPFMVNPGMNGHINTTGLIMGPGNREAQKSFNYQYMPANLHDWMYRWNEYRPNNVLLSAATPMDEDGYLYMSMCLINEAVALKSAKKIIVEVNPRMPLLKSKEGRIHISQVTCLTESNEPLTTISPKPPSELDQVIGGLAAEMIHDGDTIQIGLGGMADMVALALMEKNDLGLHTELLTPGIGNLIRAGVINGSRKNINKGKHVGVFAIGDQALYDSMSSDPNFMLVPGYYGNNPFIVAQNDNMVSVNTALEIDLTGQVCSESIGSVQFSGTGGATDYAYGALHSKGGRGIIAMSSTAKHGTISKIKAQLTPGAAVTVSRNLVDRIVTEYGVAYMRGRTIRERAQNLIAIAHPDFRGELTQQAGELGLI